MYIGTIEPVSNRADWFLTLELIDDDTGLELDDLTDVTFNLQVRTIPRQGALGWQRSPLNDYYGVQGYNCGQIVLKAVSGDEHVTTVGGVVEFHFTALEMSKLVQGAYEIGLTATKDNITDQEIIATLPIVDGIVR